MYLEQRRDCLALIFKYMSHSLLGKLVRGLVR